jgi:transposase
LVRALLRATAETEQLKQRVKELEEQFESLNEKLRKLSERTSETSSQPPSSDGPKKPNRDKAKAAAKTRPQIQSPWHDAQWLWLD